MKALQDYFTGLLGNSLGSDVSHASAQYVIGLLVRFASSEAISDSDMPVLANLYREALEESGARKLELLKRLGDVSLFLSGFFSAYVIRTGGFPYYLDMGSMAYAHVAGLRHGNLTFSELSQRFPTVVGSLNDISNRHGAEVDLAYEIHSRQPSMASWRRLVRARAIPGLRTAEG